MLVSLKKFDASDEDREDGAWHLYEVNLTNKDYDRIVFHEITKNNFAALDSPRDKHNL